MKQQAPSHMSRIDQVGQALARRLNEHATSLPHEISERLRAARMQALAVRKREPALVFEPKLVSAGGPALGPLDEGLKVWSRLGSALPLIALLLGLAFIHVVQNDYRSNELASIDAELLIDDLPPDAYTDPGFLIFLKSHPILEKAAD
jgi:hypothetical protein